MNKNEKVAVAPASAQNAQPTQQAAQDAERDLCRALLACPHTMDEQRVVLYRNATAVGGAYAQIADRLREAFCKLVSSASAQNAEAIRNAAQAVVADAIEEMRGRVHPCDQNNDEAVVRQLTPLMQNLFRALESGTATSKTGEAK
jgi:hypothetical protein